MPENCTCLDHGARHRSRAGVLVLRFHRVRWRWICFDSLGGMASAWSTGWRGVVTSGLRGVLVGAVVGVIVARLAAPAYECSLPGLDCIGVTLRVLVAALLVGVVLGWLLLRTLQVRPALPLAFAGAIATMLIAVAVTVTVSPGGRAAGDLLAMAGMAAAGYGLAATSLAEPSPEPVRIAVSVALLLGVFVLLLQM